MKRFLLLFLLITAGPLDAAPRLLLLSGGTVSFSFTVGDYDASGVALKTVTNGTVMRLEKEKKKFVGVYARAQTAAFSLIPAQPGTTANKPCSDLAVKSSNFQTYVALTTVNQLIDSNEEDDLKPVNIDYRLRSDLSVDVPGTYSLTVVYTVIQL